MVHISTVNIRKMIQLNNRVQIVPDACGLHAQTTNVASLAR